MINRRNSTALISSFFFAVAALSAAQSGFAQTKEAKAAKAAEELTEVVVTGSRLRRTEFTSASPVTIITSEQTTLDGLMSTAEILQTNTLSAGSQQINDQTTGFVTENGPGANTVALRGIGSGRTLVLLNGRRLSPAGVRGQLAAPDLNVIPSSIVQRTEILKDGASSIYGSDAIAGVINLITRKGFNGGNIELFGNAMQDSGGESIRASGSYGQTFDRGNVSIAFEHFDRKPLYVSDRDFLSCPQDKLLNVTSTSTSVFASTAGKDLDIIDPLTGASKCFAILNSVADRLQTGGRYIPDPTVLAGANAQGGTAYPNLAGWRRVGLSFAFIQAANPAATLAQQLQLWKDSQAAVPNNPAGYSKRTFSSPVTRNSVFAEGSFDLSDAAQLYGEALFSRRESSQTSFRQMFPNIATANPSNPFGQVSRSIITLPFGGSQEVDFSRAVIGVKGNIALGALDNLNYDVFFQKIQSKATYLTDIIYNDRVTATSGSAACNAAAITISTPATCQAINWFSASNILNGLSGPEAAFLYGQDAGKTTYDQDMYGASLSGNVYDLPAGPIGMAVGIEGRKESIDDLPGYNTRNGNSWGLSSAGQTKGSDTIKEAFIEMEAPLLSDEPFIKKLTLSGSSRWTDYDSYGTGNTYKAGLNWQVIDAVRIRASTGTSFRAPALYELFLADQTGFLGQSSVDPCINYDTSSNPTIVKNCGPTGTNLPAGWTNPNSSALIITGGGRGVLTAEASKNSTIGLVWTPADLPISAAVDWWRIEINNQVAQFGAGNIVSSCYNSNNFPTDPFCTLFIRETNKSATNYGQITQVKNSYVNISNQVVEGTDWTVRLNKRIGKYTLRMDANMTYNYVDSAQIFAASPSSSSRGQIYNNTWVASTSTNVERGPWTANWSMDVLSLVSNDGYYGGNVFGWRGFPSCLTSSATSTTCVAAKYDQTAGMHITHDVSLRYKADKWTGIVGIQNVADQDPPTVSTGSGATRIGNAVAISNYDILGRRMFVNLQYRF